MKFDSKIYKLIPALRKKNRLEASGVQIFRDYYYVVMDNTSSIAKIHVSLEKHHPGNELITAEKPIEQFEDITYSPAQRKFYIVIEASRHLSGRAAGAYVISSTPETVSYTAKIAEYDELFNPVVTNPVDFVFANPNKGLEGLAVINRNNTEYVLGLCEAAANNDEGNRVENQPGTGTVLVLEKNYDYWQVIRTIQLPLQVQFGDYSGLDVKGNRIAVVSQDSSTLWVGEFEESSWDFVDEGSIYQFPLSKRNKIKYCNVEGVTWVDQDTIAVVSDKRKSTDASRCKKQDQSIHVFKLPR